MADTASMFNPPHPGEFIQTVFLEPAGLSGRQLATRLHFTPSTVSRMLTGSSRVTPEMALRLSIVLGRSPESWLTMQNTYDLWMARKNTRRPTLKAIELKSA